MRAFDLGKVQGASVTANHQTARESHLRQAVQTAFGDGAGAVRYALAAFQVLFHHRMVFHALEFIKRADVRIAVRQVRNQTDHNLVIFGVIQEKTRSEERRVGKECRYRWEREHKKKKIK